MTWIKPILDFVLSSLLQELVVIIAGVLFARFIYDRWVDWRYGNWRVIIHQNGKQIVARAISPRKQKEIHTEPADLAVFLKGVSSPYGWINCDIIEEGEQLGLLVVDHDARTYTLNLDKNPPKSVPAGSLESER